MLVQQGAVEIEASPNDPASNGEATRKESTSVAAPHVPPDTAVDGTQPCRTPSDRGVEKAAAAGEASAAVGHVESILACSIWPGFP
jgi:hypothetical protein